MGGPAGKGSRPARLCVRATLSAAVVVALWAACPAPVAAQPTSWRILALRVDFPFEETDEATTSGQGGFDLRSLAVALPDYQLPYDTPPHDRAHYEAHLRGLARYYATVSAGKIAIEADVFPLNDTLAYTLPTSALRYGNGRTPEEIGGKWRELAADAIALAEADLAGPDFSEYDSYLIVHAGLGHETGQLNDIRSVYLSAADLAEYGGAIAVDGGDHVIENLWILPEAVDDRGRAGLNGLLAKFFGHQLGLPGLSNFGDGLPGVGGWSLMDVGANRIGFILHDDQLDYVFGTVPPHPLAWTKAELGWIEAVTIQRDTTITIVAGDRAPVPGIAAAQAVRVPLSPGESLWLENRQQRSRTEAELPAGVTVPFSGLELGWIEPSQVQFSHTITEAESDSLAGRGAGVWLGADEYDAFVPSSGLLIWHVDDTIIDGTPEGFNNNRERPGLVLKEADGYRDIGNRYFDRQDLTEGTRGDAFFAGFAADGTAGVDRLGPATTPSSSTNTGLETGVQIDVLSSPGDSMQVRLHFSRNLSGWPRPLPGARRLQSADVAGTGRTDLIAEGEGEVVVFRAVEADELHLQGGLLAAASSGLFLSTLDGVAAHEADGALRWTSVSQRRWAGALVAGSLSGTGAALVTVGADGLSARDPQSGAILFADDLSASGLSAADLDGDGDDDLIAVGSGGLRRYDGSVSTAIGPGAGAWLPPASGDLDADGNADIVLVDAAGQLLTVGQETDIRIGLGDTPTGPPSLADIDADGRLEIVVLTGQKLHVYHGGGLRAAGFPVSAPAHHESGPFLGEPVAADLDGNGTHEVVVAAHVGIYGLGGDGDLLPGFPVLTPGTPQLAPLAADVDGDGVADLAAAAENAVHVWQPSSWYSGFGTAMTTGWGQAGGSAAGGRAQLAIQSDPPSVRDRDLLPATRAYCYPNPVDGKTGRATIRFYLSRPAMVTLRVYDAVGNQIDHLDAANPQAAAENELTWPVSGYGSGLYLCRLVASGEDGSKGDVTLRMAVSR